MPTTLNSDMIIYNDLAQTAYLERLQDVLEVFNASSGGALILRNELIEGDLRKRSFYKIGGTLGHRNVNSDAAVAGIKIGADEAVGVKTPWKYGPYETTEEAFKRRARSPEEFSMLVGQDMADAALDYYIQTAFAALGAAIGANANMVATGSFAVDHKKVLTKGMRKFGDRFNRIALFAMDSATYFDLVDDAIDQKIYEEAGVVIYGGSPGTMGKPVLVSDKVTEERIFGLQVGAVSVTESQAPGVRSYPVNTQENLAIGYRAEGAFNVDIMGYSWKDTAGVNPNLAALGTGANWRKHATSDKATAGVLIDLSAP
ncbi:major capsid protein [Pseudomonas monteilii]|uniref:major capsid protein n=1 Tax=Pseudomonas monteilii TaxID=76759 RepID=UPI001E4AE5ED|nr:major capsid protein [Pseudomonas monteilii]MDY4311199.1 major capsid protein [Pseudomonas putida]MCE1020481.1 major capsid protein [Pseudomonas monteilii]MCE1037951.1 major capsid protein [Pseudomonas monteilii]MCE1089957.1 major capsid protein [Pseudomonas monteilii]MDY4320785.1 major capsid protein [Pseudomonas putida]